MDCSFLWYIFAIFVIFLLIKLYNKLATNWCRSPICLKGKTAIITGSNRGYETALDFAKRGARVILTCRNPDKANEACKRIIEATNNPNIIVKLVDFSSMESVRNFAKDINDTEERLDILVNNTGISGMEDTKTKDGLQLLMQVNYFSSFLLTNLLLGLLKKSSPSRIINVSSILAITASLDINNLKGFPDFYPISKNSRVMNILNKIFYYPFRPMILYGNSKLANILFTKILAQKLEGTGVTTYSLHPGFVRTENYRQIQGFTKYITNCFFYTIFKTAVEGAQTIIYMAVTKDIEYLNGEHFVNCKRIKPYFNTKNMELAKKLWKKTEEIIQDKTDEDLKIEDV